MTTIISKPYYKVILNQSGETFIWRLKAENPGDGSVAFLLQDDINLDFGTSEFGKKEGRFDLSTLDASNLSIEDLGITKIGNKTSVRDFGVKGNGNTDDTERIQRTLDSGAKEIEFPEGIYPTSRTLMPAHGQRLRGFGREPRATIKYTGTEAAINLRNAAIHIDNLRIDAVGKAVTSDTAVGINVESSTQNHVTNVVIWNFQNGVGINFVDSSFSNYVGEDTRVARCGKGIVVGNACNDIRIDDCEIVHNKVGISVEQGVASNLNIAGSYIGGNRQAGIEVTSDSKGISILQTGFEGNNYCIDFNNPDAVIQPVCIVGCFFQGNDVCDYAIRLNAKVRGMLVLASHARRFKKAFILANNVDMRGIHVYSLEGGVPLATGDAAWKIWSYSESATNFGQYSYERFSGRKYFDAKKWDAEFIFQKNGVNLGSFTVQSDGFNFNNAIKHNKAFRLNPSSVQKLASADAILVDSAHIKVAGKEGAVTLTGTPTIADGIKGDCILIRGTDSKNSVTLQDEDTLSDSNIQLGASTRELGNGDRYIEIDV